ncbi:hypothetical protein L0F63_007388 [Massospora cicadina]|nr:hypothetical protein L0F63_007388 [Massospora cicadina]
MRLEGYTFATKEAQVDEEGNNQARLQRLAADYKSFGVRRSVEAVILVHEHKHPHVLMFQFGGTYFKLPGDHLNPNEDEIEGLSKCLNRRLGSASSPKSDALYKEKEAVGGNTGIQAKDWVIGECVSTYYRPNFENFMYPYCPPHISRPKEIKKTYMVHLPDKKILTVPRNMKLIAVPLFELYDNSTRYGQQLSALPHILSRFEFEYSDQ